MKYCIIWCIIWVLITILVFLLIGRQYDNSEKLTDIENNINTIAKQLEIDLN